MREISDGFVSTDKDEIRRAIKMSTLPQNDTPFVSK